VIWSNRKPFGLPNAFVNLSALLKSSTDGKEHGQL